MLSARLSVVPEEEPEIWTLSTALDKIGNVIVACPWIMKMPEIIEESDHLSSIVCKYFKAANNESKISDAESEDLVCELNSKVTKYLTCALLYDELVIRGDMSKIRTKRESNSFTKKITDKLLIDMSKTYKRSIHNIHPPRPRLPGFI